jgi:hypothetical protein
MNLNEDEEKIEAQILAARRSLITNLVLSALCVFDKFCIYLSSPRFNLLFYGPGSILSERGLASFNNSG